MSATDTTPLVSSSDQIIPNSTSAAMSDDNNNETGGSEEPLQQQSPPERPPVPEQTAWIISIVMTAISSLVAVGTTLWISGLIAFGINWGVFLFYAWPKHTEKIYDFTGMITFLAVDIFAFVYNGSLNNNLFTQVRSIVLFILPALWTLRLGLFLFKRILGEKHGDKRFDPIRNNFPRFFMTWTLQAVWVYFCLLPVLVAQRRAGEDKMDTNTLKVSDYIGWGIWAFGWGFEVIADHQKSVFKENPENRGKFTNSGLWSITRHPNYFGEIILWIGITISASSVASGWDWLMLLSPIWTIMLLVGLSGIPIAEKAADRKYGNVPGYTEYKAKTPVLIPFCFCWR